MRLVLKRIERAVEATSLSDSEPQHYLTGMPGPFALHTEDGQLLPCQVRTDMSSEPCGPVTLTVTFRLDGDKIKVQGDE